MDALPEEEQIDGVGSSSSVPEREKVIQRIGTLEFATTVPEGAEVYFIQC